MQRGLLAHTLLGVRNPDGTAAQVVLNVNNNNHGRQGTPEPDDGSDD